LVFILESCINDEYPVVVGAVLTLENVDEGVLLDAWKAFWLVWQEVRQSVFIRSININHRGKGRDGRLEVVTLFHHVVRMLKHAVRAADLLPWALGGYG